MLRWLTYSILFCLFVALITTGFWLQHKTLHMQTEKKEIDEQTIQEAMHGVIAWRFNDQGEKVQTLNMASWYHFVEDKIIYMEKPNIQVKNEDDSIWSLCADKGKGTQTQHNGQFENVQLYQNVLIQQTKQDLLQLTLATPLLNYHPHRKIVSTDQNVQVTSESMQMIADGMIAELDSKKFSFFGKVRSIYDDTSF